MIGNSQYGAQGSSQPANRREQKENQKDTYQQARLFKQLQEESLQLNQLLVRSTFQDQSSTGGLQDQTGNRYLAFSHAFGQRAGGLMGVDRSGRSIDQIYQNLKQKADQSSLTMNQTAETESKAFFNSKNVDINSLEHSLKAAQNTLLQFKTKQQQVSAKPLGLGQRQPQLLTSYVGVVDQKALSAQTFKDQLTSHIYQGANLTKGQLQQDLSSKVNRAFKIAAQKVQMGTERLQMPPLRKFYELGPIREEAKEGQPREAQVIIQKERDQNVVRDISDMEADENLLDRLLNANIELKYDEKYLNEKKHRFLEGIDLTQPRFKHFFLVYSSVFKKYTEEKVYSGFKNITSYCKQLFEFEDELKKQYGGDAEQKDVHQYFADIWELLQFFSESLEEFSAKDRILFIKKYQRAVAKVVAKYLEQDFQKNIRSLDKFADPFTVYENYVESLLQNAPEEAKRYVYFDNAVSTYPFAVAFFMFRSGSHSSAISYLEKFESEPIKKFGELYKTYYITYKESIPRSQIEGFVQKSELFLYNIDDMYKDALINLMIGNTFKPQNEHIFWEYLLPMELETQLWFKLKLAQYNLKEEEKSSFEMEVNLPSYHQEYTLEDFHRYITKDLGSQYFAAAGGILTYFKVLMLIGKYSEALDELNKYDDFKVHAAFFAIALNELGLLRTRYQFLGHVQANKQEVKEKYVVQELSNLLSDCFDYQTEVYHMAYLIEKSQTYVTEAISVLLFLEDKDLILISLAQYIINGQLYSLILENNQQESILNFETNTNLTLRSLLPEDMFLKLVTLIVQMNDVAPFMNVFLLDKINQHEEVLKYLIRIQKLEIEKKLPEYFILPDKTSEHYKNHLRKTREQIAQITKEQAALLNQYQRQDIKKKFPNYYIILDQLEIIASAFNRVWDEKYEDAMKEFANLYFLPMKKNDQPNTKVKDYIHLDSNVKGLIFECIMTIAKLIQHIHFKIVKETNKFQDMSKPAEMKKRQLDEYKDVLNKIVLYLEALKNSNAVEHDKLQKLVDTTNECKKIWIEIV